MAHLFLPFSVQTTDNTEVAKSRMSQIMHKTAPGKNKWLISTSSIALPTRAQISSN